MSRKPVPPLPPFKLPFKTAKEAMYHARNNTTWWWETGHMLRLMIRWPGPRPCVTAQVWLGDRLCGEWRLPHKMPIPDDDDGDFDWGD